MQEREELTFSEAMLSDIATDVAKVRRNTGFVALMLLLMWVVIPLVFLLLNVIGTTTS